MNQLKKADSEIFPIIIPNNTSLKSVNFYIVRQGPSLSLIDAGWNNEECWDGLLDTLHKNGYALQDLTEILLTHHHIDHIGLVNRITSEHHIPVYAHPESIPRLTRDHHFLEVRAEFYAQLYKEMGCGVQGERQAAYLKKAIQRNMENAIQADITAIGDEQLLHFRILEVPGHAPDQIAFYDERQKWLFAGDLLIDHISSNAFVEPDLSGKRMPTLLHHIDSLNKCLTLDIELVYSGHGTFIDQPRALIGKRLDGIKTKADRLTKLINAGCSTASEIAQSYYKNTYNEQFPLVMSEIIGHLDYLEDNGRIRKELIQGIWHYSVLEQ